MPVDEHAIEYLNKSIDEVKSDISNIRTELDSKVGYDWFWAVIGILCAVVGGMFYLVYNNQIEMNRKLDGVYESTSDTKTNMFGLVSQLKALELIK